MFLTRNVFHEVLVHLLYVTYTLYPKVEFQGMPDRKNCPCLL